MRYWDSSAIVCLLFAERHSATVSRLVGADPAMQCWWSTSLECVSACARRERSGTHSPAVVTEAIAALDQLSTGWTIVEPSEAVMMQARRLLRVHSLRAADALQLAAAMVGANPVPDQSDFVCLDLALRDAADKEGFRVLPADI